MVVWVLSKLQVQQDLHNDKRIGRVGWQCSHAREFRFRSKIPPFPEKSLKLSTRYVGHAVLYRYRYLSTPEAFSNFYACHCRESRLSQSSTFAKSRLEYEYTTSCLLCLLP